MPSPVVIIVPGAWHKPQHYARLIDHLGKSSLTAIAVDLPSVDSSPPHTTWEQDAQEVRRVILEQLDAGKDVITIGHSFGGVAMSEAVKGLGKKERLESGSATGVVRLIYMCAYALPAGMSQGDQMVPVTPEEAEWERERQELVKWTGAVKITEDGAMVLRKDIVRDLFYNQCATQDQDEALDLLGLFPAAPFGVPVTYTAYKEIPSTYIICENDMAIPPCIQERMVAQGEGAFHVERCAEGHSPFLSNPGFIVGCVERDVEMV